jgi:magnesium transporter
MSEDSTIDLDALKQMHPADLADRLQRLSLEDAQESLLALPRKQAADALSEMEWEKAEELLESLPEEKLAGFFLELSHSDVADLLGLLPPGNQRRLLDRLPTEHSNDIRQLLRYSEDSAGGIMTDRFIALRSDRTVQQSMDMLRSRPEQEREDVSY